MTDGEFEIEVKRKKCKVVFARPELEHQDMFFDWLVKREAELKKAEKGENVSEGVMLVKEAQSKKNELLFSLMEENTAIASVEDFRRIPIEDLKRLWDWFDIKAGIKMSMEDGDFLSSSKK